MDKVSRDITEYIIVTTQNWKIQSRKLLLKYKDDKDSFKKVLHDVVGKGSGVLRNIKKEDFPQFSEYVRQIVPEIKKGQYDIFSVKKSLKIKTISYVSKVCHIINPKSYPIIYDSYNKQTLKIKDNQKTEEDWNRVIKEFKGMQTGKESLEELYMIDTKLWVKRIPAYK